MIDSEEIIVKTWNTFMNGPHTWNFEKNGPLYWSPPLEYLTTLTTDPEGVVDHVVFQMERGHFEGRPARRIMGKFKNAEHQVAVWFK